MTGNKVKEPQRGERAVEGEIFQPSVIQMRYIVASVGAILIFIGVVIGLGMLTGMALIDSSPLVMNVGRVLVLALAILAATSSFKASLARGRVKSIGAGFDPALSDQKAHHEVKNRT